MADCIPVTKRPTIQEKNYDCPVIFERQWHNRRERYDYVKVINTHVWQSTVCRASCKASSSLCAWHEWCLSPEWSGANYASDVGKVGGLFPLHSLIGSYFIVQHSSTGLCIDCLCTSEWFFRLIYWFTKLLLLLVPPIYLISEPLRTLSSSGSGFLIIPRVRAKSQGEVSFSHCGHKLV